MPPRLRISEAIAAHLETSGLTQTPDAVGGLPVCWTDPLDGAPQPEGDATAAVTVQQTGGVAPEWTEGFLLRVTFDVITRAVEPDLGIDIAASIEDTLVDRYALTAGGLRIEQVTLWRPSYPLTITRNLARGELPERTTHDRTSAFIAQVRRAVLAGA